jgi:uncharacterized RDD family membrane protein YckC
MYCRECGNQVNPKAEICTSCGVRPLNSNKHCQGCGSGTTPQQEMCVQCHTLLTRSASKERYSGFWLRFFACFIDGIIISIPLMIVSVVLLVMVMGEAMMYGYYDESAMVGFQFLCFLIALVIGILYTAGMHSSKWQATIGKRMMGIKVTDLHGNRISFARAVGRFFGTYLSALIMYIGFLMAGFTQKKQALHDMVAGTLVVKK